MPLLHRSNRPSGLRRWLPWGLAPAFGAAIGLLALLFLPPAAVAELVVLDDGRHFKVRGYEVVDGDRARLSLPEGGRVTLPLGRVAHVVDDEWVPPEPEPEVHETAAGGRSWRFTEGHAVPDVPHGEAIYRAARRHGVAPELVAAVVRAESAFEVRAVSVKGARGLMQLMPATARRFGVPEERVFEPAANLDAGTRYLAWLLERFEGELALALAAYNAGEGTVDRYGDVPPFRETRSYIQRIFATLGLAPPAQVATRL
ncbi:MAG: lytic transglycosylase domain-containing protein [Thermoanaerobaculia bacterium]